MILGVVSDTHVRAPNARFESLLSRELAGAEALVHAGDFTGEAVVDYLEFVDPRPFYGVGGNMDLWNVKGRLPPKRVERIAGLRVGIVHGWGAPSGLTQRVLDVFEEPVDVVIFGHSHRATWERIGEIWVLNPGSAFDSRFAPSCTVALLEVGSGEPKATFREVSA
ncbi:MAG: metallophosphoesterase [Deferrisomatales bacterium]